MTADSLPKVIRDLRAKAAAIRAFAEGLMGEGAFDSIAAGMDAFADRLDAIAARPVAWAVYGVTIDEQKPLVLNQRPTDGAWAKLEPNARVVGLIIGSDGVETEQKRTGPAVTYGPGGNHGSMGPG